jgi:gluconokinase/shikimate kinase
VATGRRTLSSAVAVERPPVLVLMGVSGCGKSTVAGVLAGRLGWAVAEGDELHPPENVAKMAAGQPLTDDDRKPWLQHVAAWIGQWVAAHEPGVITCSALRRSYRDDLREPHVVFVYLRGSRDEIARRLAVRHGHFMPLALLDSQFATLEPPDEDEQSLTVDIGPSPTDQAEQIVRRLDLSPT